jgi:restriction endonuclease S subunit
MKNNWSTKKLGEVIDINFGERITKNNNSGNKYPVYGGGGESFKTDHFNRENEFVISRFAIAENCVRFVVGKFWLMDSGGTFSVKKDNVDKLDKNFVGNVLFMRQKEIYNCARGGAQQNIDVDYFKKIKIPLPPLETQKQIVEKLDKISEAQKLNDGLIQKTDELFQSLLHKELNPVGLAEAKAMAGKKGWEVKKLVEVADFLDNLRKPVTASDRVPGPYPYYGANGQQDSVGDYIFNDELVLLAEDGGYFGSKTRPVAYRVSGKCWINNHAHVLKNKNEVSDIDFLGYSLMYYDVTPYVTGSTRAKLNKSAAEKIKIFLPSLEIQKQIVAKLSAVQDYKKQLLKQKSKLKELFDSALAKSLA